MLRRRGLLGLLGAALVAPAVVKAGGLMPVRSITPDADLLERVFNGGGVVPSGRYLLERPISLYGGTGGVLRGCIIEYPDRPPPAGFEYWGVIGNPAPAHLDRGRMSYIEENWFHPHGYTPPPIRLVEAMP